MTKKEQRTANIALSGMSADGTQLQLHLYFGGSSGGRIEISIRIFNQQL